MLHAQWLGQHCETKLRYRIWIGAMSGLEEGRHVVTFVSQAMYICMRIKVQRLMRFFEINSPVIQELVSDAKATKFTKAHKLSLHTSQEIR
jgi:hypothetical protein